MRPCFPRQCLVDDHRFGSAGCITDDGKDDTGASTCAVGRVVHGTSAISVSPNGATLYDSGGLDHGFSVFHINSDGTLTQLSGTGGCVTIDGKDNTSTSTCATGRAINSAGTSGPTNEILVIVAGAVPCVSLAPPTGVAANVMVP